MQISWYKSDFCVVKQMLFFKRVLIKLYRVRVPVRSFVRSFVGTRPTGTKLRTGRVPTGTRVPVRIEEGQLYMFCTLQRTKYATCHMSSHTFVVPPPPGS